MFNAKTMLDEHILQQILSPSTDHNELSLQDAIPTIGKVVRAIQRIRNIRAARKDDVTAEFVKTDGLPLAKWLHKNYP
jgi:hypothetical protein